LIARGPVPRARSRRRRLMLGALARAAAAIPGGAARGQGAFSKVDL